MVLVQKWPFFHLVFFQRNIGQENVFYDLDDDDDDDLDEMSFMVQKWPFFDLVFFQRNTGQENVFYDILE